MFILADDLTGAAEAGGIALHFGLSAEVQTGQCHASDVDAIVADTDSRQRSARQAADIVRARYEQSCGLSQRHLSQRRLFKKVDSVLRGNVIAETAALLEATGRQRALLVPASPGLQRTVSDGQYWIDGVALDRTDFANDPEHPAVTAYVGQLLAHRAPQELVRRWPLTVAALDEELPALGIVVGEVRSSDEMLAWAKRVDDETVPVGSAAFLDAYLLALGMTKVAQPPTLPHAIAAGKRLFVSGSTSESSRQFCRTCESVGIPVMRMPVGLFERTANTDALVAGWVAATVEALERHKIVVIAIDQPVRDEPGLPQRITEHLSRAVQMVLPAVRVEHLLAEGGATAEALMQRMNWQRLTMVAELAPGVVSTQVVEAERLIFTMKPGSYTWPQALRN